MTDNRRDYGNEETWRLPPGRSDRSRRTQRQNPTEYSRDPDPRDPPARSGHRTQRQSSDRSWEADSRDERRASGASHRDGRDGRDYQDSRDYRDRPDRDARDDRGRRSGPDRDAAPRHRSSSSSRREPPPYREEGRAAYRDDREVAYPDEGREKFVSPPRPRTTPPPPSQQSRSPQGNRTRALSDRDRDSAAWEDEERRAESRRQRPDVDRERDGRRAPGPRGSGVRSRQIESEDDYLEPPVRGRSGSQWRSRESVRESDAEPPRDRRQPSWDSWDDDEAGHFENQDSVWAPAWQREQAAEPSARGGRPGRNRGAGGPAGEMRVGRGGRVGDLGQRSADVAKRAGTLVQTSYQSAIKQQKRILSTRKGRIISAIVAASLLLGMFGTIGLAYAEYHHVKSQTTVALADLKAAEVDLKTLQTDPFNTTAITAAHDNLAQANAAFVQMNDTLQHIPGVLGITPIVGSKISSVLQLGPIAVEATQAGMLGCDILSILAPALKNPLATNIPGLTSADMNTVQSKFSTVYSLVSTMLGQVQNLPPSAASLDPRLGSLLGTLSGNLPAFEQGLQDVKNVVTDLPQLLGVGKPANYLLEVMDSTELRPGGGFIGNLGAITLSGGRMQGKPQIKDVDLLDKHDCALGINLPANLSWFTSGCPTTLLFQDSNLLGDFPSDAARALTLYTVADGSSVLDNNSAGPIKTFQGVIAVTPQLIANAMAITGNITLPQYGGLVVTPQNMSNEIHYYQLHPGLGGSDTQIDPTCGSSQRKVFTCYLFKAFLSKLGQASSTNFGALGKLVENAIHSKDIQLYFSNARDEALLQHHDLASAINAPKTGDGLMVVDANIDGVKANNFINYTWNDKISIDSAGNATHHLVLTYDYASHDVQAAIANSYPSHAANVGCPSVCYQDYVRIYIPSQSNHISPSDNLDSLGGAPTTTSEFNMAVVQGLIFLPIGEKFTVSTSWTVPNAAVQTGNGWLYQDTIQKQAGISWPINETVTLPSSCTGIPTSSQGFTKVSGDSAVATEPLMADTTISLQYAC